MKILILISTLRGGGAERVAAYLANSWVSDGAEVCLVTFFGSETDAYPLSRHIERVPLHMGGASSSIVHAMAANVARVAALRKIIRKAKPSAVLALMTGSAVPAILATRGLSIPTFVSERTFPPMFPLGWIWERLRRITYPMADSVVMQTREGLRWLEGAIPTSRGVVIPNPVTFPLPDAEPMVAVDSFVSAGRRLILAAGRLDAGKQFDQLIDVFNSLSAEFPDWDLVILGEGPLKHKLSAQVKALNLSRRVSLPGHAGNVGHWYGRADIFVMTSRFEGFPNALVEAMAYGCATVSYDCDTGPRDIIREGVDGVLVRPVGNVESLRETLGDLMGNACKRAHLGERATEVIDRFAPTKVFSMWDGMVRQYVNGARK